MSIYDVSYKVKVALSQGPWFWKTFRGIESRTEAEARSEAITRLRALGLDVAGDQWIISNREEVTSGTNT